MALQTTTEIYIASKLIPSYVSLNLTQELAEHHSLKLVCRTDVLESLSSELIGESKDFLGETITLKVSSFSMGSGYKDLEFKGVITGVSSQKGFQQSSGDLIVIKAKSCSILSDDGPHYASYTDKNLSEILEQAFQGYDRGKLETSFTPQNSEAIGYTVQYKQSSFDFAKRLAAYHGEWFYDDGKSLVFGQPSTEELELDYGSDLSEFTLDLNTSPILFQYLADDYVNDEVYKKESSGISTSSEGHHGFMGNTSKSVFPKETIIHHTIGGDKIVQGEFT